MKIRPPVWLQRLIIAATPLAATFLFAFLTMEGYLNFGGGEKDILLVVPLLVFSLVFLAVGLIAGWRGLPPARAARLSALFALGTVLLLWLALLAFVMAGRRP